MTDIHTILKDPRYGEFLAALKREGRLPRLECFPWKYIGMSDEAFLALDLKCEGGATASWELKRDWLPCVRSAERDLGILWDWWLSWEWLEKGKVQPPVSAPSPAAAPGMLF